MKKILIITLCVFSVKIFAQNKADIAAFKKYDGTYTIEHNGDIAFVRIYEDLAGTKDEIYTRAMSYFSTEYKSKEDVIQHQDKEAGVIIAKQLVLLRSQARLASVMQYYVVQMFRVDIKDNRCRIVVSIREYEMREIFYGGVNTKTVVPIIETYPFVAEPTQGKKKSQIQSFTNYASWLLKQLDVLKTYIEGGGNAINTNDDW